MTRARSGLAGFTVFADADHDGLLDPSETFDVTDSNGRFCCRTDTGELERPRGGQVGLSCHDVQRRVPSDVTAGGIDNSSTFGQFRFLTTSGNTVTIEGTPNADQFHWQAGTTQHAVTLNGTTYQYAAATYRNFVFNGLVGNDSVSLYGGVNSDTVNFDRYQVTLTDGVYTVSSQSGGECDGRCGPGSVAKSLLPRFHGK